MVSLGRRGAAVAAAVICSFAADASFAKDSLLALTPEHFRDTATLETGPHGNALISTQNGFKEYAGPLHMLWHDEYLTALIDGKTGGKSFQVRADITYRGNWRYYHFADRPVLGACLGLPRQVP